MTSPNKDWDTASRLGNRNHFVNNMSKEFIEKKSPQTERLSLKKYDDSSAELFMSSSSIFTKRSKGGKNKQIYIAITL